MRAMSDGNGDRGLSQREILMEIRGQLTTFIKLYHIEQRRQDEEIAKRPTRQEIMALLAGAGVLSGIFFGIVQIVI